MYHSVNKALYVYVSTILGTLLFFIIHRAVILLYYLLLDVDYAYYSFGMTRFDIQSFDVATMIMMIVLGGWYGVWLGLHWYEVVYEKGGGHWWYAFRGQLFHHPAPAQVSERPSASRFPIASPAKAKKIVVRDAKKRASLLRPSRPSRLSASRSLESALLGTVTRVRLRNKNM